jgi:chromosome segregation ATPase
LTAKRKCGILTQLIIETKEKIVDNPSLEDMLVQIAQLNKQIEEAKAAIDPLTDHLLKIDAEVTEVRNASAEEIWELQLQIHKVEEQRDEDLRKKYEERAQVNEQKFDLKRLADQAQREAESLQRQIDQMRRAELAKAEWSTLEQRWDQMTMGAPWREWAKDHQLSGAKKITYEGRLILADTMGLGKTLTSLVAIDMIEAATKDASPDNPVTFGKA